MREYLLIAWDSLQICASHAQYVMVGRFDKENPQTDLHFPAAIKQ